MALERVHTDYPGPRRHKLGALHPKIIIDVFELHEWVFALHAESIMCDCERVFDKYPHGRCGHMFESGESADEHVSCK